MPLNPDYRKEISDERNDHESRRQRSDGGYKYKIGEAFGLGVLLALGAVATMLALGVFSDSKAHGYYSPDESIPEHRRQIEPPYLRETIYIVE